MFIGEYHHTFDSKGRVSIPIKFRFDLGSSAIITKGLDNCLFVYPKGEWEKITNKLSQLPMANSDARSLIRMMLSGAIESELDKQGRVLLPVYLRDYAEIKNEAVIAGVLNRIEIWSQTRWQTYLQEAEAKQSEISNNLSQWEI